MGESETKKYILKKTIKKIWVNLGKTVKSAIQD